MLPRAFHASSAVKIDGANHLTKKLNIIFKSDLDDLRFNAEGLSQYLHLFLYQNKKMKDH